MLSKHVLSVATSLSLATSALAAPWLQPTGYSNGNCTDYCSSVPSTSTSTVTVTTISTQTGVTTTTDTTTITSTDTSTATRTVILLPPSTSVSTTTNTFTVTSFTVTTSTPVVTLGSDCSPLPTTNTLPTTSAGASKRQDGVEIVNDTTITDDSDDADTSGGYCDCGTAGVTTTVTVTTTQTTDLISTATSFATTSTDVTITTTTLVSTRPTVTSTVTTSTVTTISTTSTVVGPTATIGPIYCSQNITGIFDICDTNGEFCMDRDRVARYSSSISPWELTNGVLSVAGHSAAQIRIADSVNGGLVTVDPQGTGYSVRCDTSNGGFFTCHNSLGQPLTWYTPRGGRDEMGLALVPPPDAYTFQFVPFNPQP